MEGELVSREDLPSGLPTRVPNPVLPAAVQFRGFIGRQLQFGFAFRLRPAGIALQAGLLIHGRCRNIRGFAPCVPVSSRGQDTWFSATGPGFESPYRYQRIFCRREAFEELFERCLGRVRPSPRHVFMP